MEKRKHKNLYVFMAGKNPPLHIYKTGGTIPTDMEKAFIVEQSSECGE
jgi:hypothetical protein